MKKFHRYIGSAVILCGSIWGQTNISSKPKEVSSLAISSVPSSFPVNFALFTKDENQFAAFYDAEHIMTIASRKLNDTSWSYKKLNSKIEWDSHNYLALMAD
ncbi:MAG: BNR-4 repeat-containing protein, partial [Ignavibacteria bacterium]|nr:BNR-4 repeat-containing protein [Ignavibacteria bacterium]